MATEGRNTESVVLALDSKLEVPLPLQEAGDLATASLVLTALEWRACLTWALVFGLPQSILLIGFGSEHSSHTAPGWFVQTGVPILVSGLFEPFMAATALVYLKARADGTPFRLAQGMGVGLACLFPLAVVSSLSDVARILVTPLLSPFGWVGSTAAVAIAGVVHLASLIAAPLVLFHGAGLVAALRQSVSAVRAEIRTYAAAYTMLFVALYCWWAALQTPAILQSNPQCGFYTLNPLCSMWWRALYLWLTHVTSGPFYALAYLAYLRMTAPELPEPRK